MLPHLPPELINEIIFSSLPSPSFKAHINRNAILGRLSLIDGRWSAMAQAMLPVHLALGWDGPSDKMKEGLRQQQEMGRRRTRSLALVGDRRRPSDRADDAASEELLDLLGDVGEALSEIWVESVEVPWQLEALGTVYLPNLRSLSLRDVHPTSLAVSPSLSFASLTHLSIDQSSTIDWSILRLFSTSLRSLAITNLKLNPTFNAHFRFISHQLTSLTLCAVPAFEENYLAQCTHLLNLTYDDQSCFSLPALLAPVETLELRYDCVSKAFLAVTQVPSSAYATLRKIRVPLPVKEGEKERTTKDGWEGEMLARLCKERGVRLEWIEGVDVEYE